MTHSPNYKWFANLLIIICLLPIVDIILVDSIIASRFIIKLCIIIRWVKARKESNQNPRLKCLWKLKKYWKKHLKSELQLILRFFCNCFNITSSWQILSKKSTFNVLKDLWNKQKFKKSDNDNYFAKRVSQSLTLLYFSMVSWAFVSNKMIFFNSTKEIKRLTWDPV